MINPREPSASSRIPLSWQWLPQALGVLERLRRRGKLFGPHSLACSLCLRMAFWNGSSLLFPLGQPPRLPQGPSSPQPPPRPAQAPEEAPLCHLWIVLECPYWRGHGEGLSCPLSREQPLPHGPARKPLFSFRVPQLSSVWVHQQMYLVCCHSNVPSQIPAREVTPPLSATLP